MTFSDGIMTLESLSPRFIRAVSDSRYAFTLAS
jgi:hypothetical protein